MKIAILSQRYATKEVLADLNTLLKQLVHDPKTYKPITFATLKKIASDKKTVVVLIFDGTKVIGTGTLIIATKFRGNYAYIEDMMVDESYRGQGLGRQLGDALVAAAKKHNVTTIELSTRPSRVAANALYQKMGFEPKDTNVYRLKL